MVTLRQFSPDPLLLTLRLSYVQTDIAKFKGLLIKIKVIEGFSAKLKDFNQIKGF